MNRPSIPTGLLTRLPSGVGQGKPLKGLGPPPGDSYSPWTGRRILLHCRGREGSSTQKLGNGSHGGV